MSNNKGSFIKNIISVTISNVSTIVSGVIVGFILPKILPVEDYGWYKTFTLYMTYVGLFSLGIIDGIVLKYGGYNYDEIDRTHFRAYFKWYILVHVFFACVINFFAILLNDSHLHVILVIVSVNMIAVNITGYFQQISQITQRFKEYSLRKIIQSILNIIVVGIFCSVYIITGNSNYVFYLVIFVVSNVGLSLWYIYTYRGIVFGSAVSLKTAQSEVLGLCKKGFPLLFANLCSTIILTLDRQFVNIFFDTSIYAKYAFAYNMLALVTVATSAMSTVIYPALKRTSKQLMRKNYTLLISVISIIVFGTLLVYFPLCLFVEWFLPKYEESLNVFRIVFPGLALSSPITVIMHNFYKVEGKSFLYFKKCIVVLLISAMANEIAYLMYDSTQAISIASIVTMIFWYFFVEYYFYKYYSCFSIKNTSYTLFMMLIFYLISNIKNYYLGFGIYIILFVAITYSIYKNDCKDIIKILRK